MVVLSVQVLVLKRQREDSRAGAKDPAPLPSEAELVVLSVQVLVLNRESEDSRAGSKAKDLASLPSETELVVLSVQVLVLKREREDSRAGSGASNSTQGVAPEQKGQPIRFFRTRFLRNLPLTLTEHVFVAWLWHVVGTSCGGLEGNGT